jgi:hypothetical protein
MQDVLDVLIDQQYAKYSMSELASLTEANKGTISKAVKLTQEAREADTESPEPDVPWFDA